MQLKRIELYGFKSFGQKTVLHFDHPISVIVGPNGSGKSNIADAIRWVLGEQSAKSLRGGKMEDVIFSGTDRKKPLNMTQVSMVLDNSGQELPIAYDEVVVTRKLFRSGETEYSLNKSPCRLKDIRNLFMDTGVGKEGYSIIGQGKIDEIISARDQDRRELFEEATGISKFRYQIEESRTKLRKTRENLVRVEDIIAQLKEQLRYLSREADKARKGMELAAEHEKHTLAYYDRELKAAQLLVKGLVEEKELLRDSLEKVQNERDLLLQAIRPLLQAKEEHEAQLASWEEELRILRKNTENAERMIQLSEQKSEFLQKETTGLQAGQKRIEEEITRLQDRLAELVREEDVLHKKQQQDTNRQKKEEQEVTALQRQWEENLHGLEAIRQQAKDSERKLQELRLQAHAYESEERIRLDQAGKLKESIREEEARQKQQEEELERLQQALQDVEKRYSDMVASLEESAALLTRLEQQSKEEEALLRNLRNEADAKQRRIQSLDQMIRNHEGYHRSVQQLLRAAKNDAVLADKFIGPLGSLIRVAPEYRVSVEVALGAAMNQIVTREAEQAKELIEWLKQNKIGRATFLPIRQIKAYKYTGAWLDEKEGCIGPALSFVSSDDEIRSVLQSLLGRTAIIKDMDAGILLRKQSRYDSLRLVTLSGEMLMPGGSMVGGYLQKEGGLLSRETEKEQAEKALSSLRTQILELERSLAALETGKNECTTARDLKRTEGRQLHEERRTAQEHLAAQQAGLQVLVRNLAQMNQQYAQFEKNRTDETLQEELRLLQVDSEQHAQQLSGLEEEKHAIEKNLRIAERDYAHTQAQADAGTRDLVLVKNRQAETIEQQQNRENERAETVLQLAETKTQAEEELLRQKELRIQIQAGQEKNRAIEQKSIECRRALQSVAEELQASEAQRQQTEEAYRSLEKDQATHALRLENARERAQRIVEAVAMELNVDEATAATKMQHAQELKTGRAKVRELKDQLRALGSFSYESIEEHQSVHERYQFLSEQSDDLKQSDEDLSEVIRKLEATMRSQFKSGIAEINQKFSEVFKKLFDGGQAEIALTGEDVLEAGVQIIARPPGKSRQAISLLSGGEKALTAVALLFAIFETRPSPFCVLDEIDAALDDANIARYKQYLAGFRGRIQFIIITHRKQTMELADMIYGVTMQENSTSRIIPLELADKKKEQSAS